MTFLIASSFSRDSTDSSTPINFEQGVNPFAVLFNLPRADVVNSTARRRIAGDCLVRPKRRIRPEPSQNLVWKVLILRFIQNKTMAIIAK